MSGSSATVRDPIQLEIELEEDRQLDLALEYLRECDAVHWDKPPVQFSREFALMCDCGRPAHIPHCCSSGS